MYVALLSLCLAKMPKADEQYPELVELARFPTAKIVRQTIALNRARRTWLERELVFHWDREAIWMNIAYLDDAKEVWEDLQRAQDEDYCEATRCLYLHRLRWQLGERDWQAGRMPLPVPW